MPAALTKAAVEGMIADRMAAVIEGAVKAVNAEAHKLSSVVEILQAKMLDFEKKDVHNIKECEDLLSENISLKKTNAALEAKIAALEFQCQAANKRPVPAIQPSPIIHSSRPEPPPLPTSTKVNESTTRPSWTQVVRKSRKVIVGTQQVRNSAMKAVPTGYPVKVFVSRLSPTMLPSAVEEEVLVRAGVAVKATKLVSKMPWKYSSYLLDCLSTDLKTLLHPSVWAQGLVVKRWYEPRPRIGVVQCDEPPNMNNGGITSTLLSAPAGVLPDDSRSDEQSSDQDTPIQNEFDRSFSASGDTQAADQSTENVSSDNLSTEDTRPTNSSTQ